MKNFTS